MAKIARWGKGKAYVAEDVAQVPEIFIEDTQNVSRTTLIEDPFRPVVKRKIEALRGLDFAQAPPLLGFASTKAKDGAEVFLATESGAPMLARWQYGLGRTVMFASDVKNRWAAQWLSGKDTAASGGRSCATRCDATRARTSRSRCSARANEAHVSLAPDERARQMAQPPRAERARHATRTEARPRCRCGRRPRASMTRECR